LQKEKIAFVLETILNDLFYLKNIKLFWHHYLKRVYKQTSLSIKVGEDFLLGKYCKTNFSFYKNN